MSKRDSETKNFNHTMFLNMLNAQLHELWHRAVFSLTQAGEIGTKHLIWNQVKRLIYSGTGLK